MTTHARLLVLSAALSAVALGRVAARSPEPADGGAELRARIAAAAPGATVHVAAGRYTGPFEIDRPLTLIGHGRLRRSGRDATERRRG